MKRSNWPKTPSVPSIPKDSDEPVCLGLITESAKCHLHWLKLCSLIDMMMEKSCYWDHSDYAGVWGCCRFISSKCSRSWWRPQWWSEWMNATDVRWLHAAVQQRDVCAAWQSFHAHPLEEEDASLCSANPGPTSEMWKLAANAHTLGLYSEGDILCPAVKLWHWTCNNWFFLHAAVVIE